MNGVALKDRVVEYLGRFLRTPFSSLLVRAFFRRPVFIITTNPGAYLGNQLTIFAHVIACARETGREIWGPSFFVYAKHFEHTSRDCFTRFPERTSLCRGQWMRVFLYYYVFARLVRVLVLRPLPPVKDVAVITDYDGKQSLESSAFLSQIREKRLALIEGYFFRCSMEKLKKHSGVIKEYLRPLRRHEVNASAVVGQARGRGEVLVGVHLRQFGTAGDENPHHLYRFENAERMNGALRQTVGCFPGKKVTFLLFSNMNIDISRYSEFSTGKGTGHIAEDLHALSLCDYILASTYSTYSRWASFYGSVPLYQLDAPGSVFSLRDFQVQIPGFYDPSDEASPIQV